jgi:hypothetical protein
VTPGPNLFVVGAAKAGTTSLWAHLRSHPDVFMCQPKEPHFFSCGGLGPLQISIKEPEPYARLFAPGARKRYRGEASPSYLWDPETPARIKAAVPDARIVVSLRDPVDRAWSNYVMSRSLGFEHRSFAQALDEELTHGAEIAAQPSPYIFRGRYAEQLERYLELFGDATIVLWFDELAADVRGTMRMVFERLGIDPRPADRLDPAPVIPHLRPRSGAADVLLRVPGARRSAGAILRGRLRRLVEAAVFEHVKPELDPEIRRMLRDVFAPHDDRLRALVGRALPWDGRE